MASKPRNLSTSPTNLSPSRIAIRNSSSSSAVASRSTGGGSKKSSSHGTSSPIGSAGRTPQTRRKELALQNSPQGSPKVNNVKKNSSSTTNTRKNSSAGLKNNNNNKRSRAGVGTTRALNSTSAVETKTNHEKVVPPSLPSLKLREETKFDGLWDVKTIDNGLVRIPTQCLEELISRESIEKFYEVEENPVAK